MSMTDNLEKRLNKLLVTDAPYKLPKNVKDWIVKYLPYINLVFGFLSLYSAYVIYSWARTTNTYINSFNDAVTQYTPEVETVPKLTPLIWLVVVLTTVQAIIYISSFGYLNKKQKIGWNLMLVATILYAVYGFLGIFTDYGSIFNLTMYIISTFIGLYILFQIRAYYLKSNPRNSNKNN